jgi:hypothetical protein
MSLSYSTIAIFCIFTLLALNACAATAPSLRSCLKSVTGLEVVTSGDSNFQKARQAFDLRFTYDPQAVVVSDSMNIYKALKSFEANVIASTHQRKLRFKVPLNVPLLRMSLSHLAVVVIHMKATLSVEQMDT